MSQLSDLFEEADEETQGSNKASGESSVSESPATPAAPVVGVAKEGFAQGAGTADELQEQTPAERQFLTLSSGTDGLLDLDRLSR